MKVKEDSLVCAIINPIKNSSYMQMKCQSVNIDKKVPTGNQDNISSNTASDKYASLYSKNNLFVNKFHLPSFASSVNNSNLDDIQVSSLPNNVKLIIASSPEIKQSEISFRLKPNTLIQAKPESTKLLSLMLNESSKVGNDTAKQGIINFTDVVGKTIITRVKCDSNNTALASDLLKKTLFNPEFSEEKLANAKQLLKNSHDFALKDAGSQMEMSLSGNEFDKDKKTIDEVSLQDIQDLYKKIIDNSEGKVVVTVPKQNYSNLKNGISQSFSNGIPKLMNSSEISDPNTTSSKPLNKTKIFIQSNDKDNSAKISQSFKIVHNGNINDIVSVRLLSVLLGEYNNSRLSKNLKDVTTGVNNAYTDCYEYTENKNIRLNVSIPSNDNLLRKFDIKNCLEGFKNSVNSLVDSPVSTEELQSAKLILKKSLLKDLSDSSQKNDFLQLNSAYGTNYINSYINAIDTISPADLQKAAQEYLTKPSSISIVADENAIKSNKSYLSSLGDVSDLNK